MQQQRAWDLRYTQGNSESEDAFLARCAKLVGRAEPRPQWKWRLCKDHTETGVCRHERAHGVSFSFSSCVLWIKSASL